MPPTPRKRAAPQWPMFLIFLVVCLACLLLAVVAGSQSYRELLHELQSARKDQQTPTVDTSAASAHDLKDEFDNLKDRTDNLQKLITTLIALSSLYAIVLTITGYLNVQKILQEAQVSLDDALETQDLLGKEYGSLTHISENLEKVTRELRDRLPDVQELSASFGDLTLDDHERLYFQENAIAFAQLVVPDKDPEISDRLSGAFVSLARFYRGYYLSKKSAAQQKREQAQAAAAQPAPAAAAAPAAVVPTTPVAPAAPVVGPTAPAAKTPPPVPAPSQADEDLAPILPFRARALFYARQAILHSPNNFIALNELGNCLLEFESANLDAAHDQFRESLIRNRNQQKARFYLSSILHRRREYKRAEVLLTEALALDFWETTEESARKSDLYYNRACAYGKLAEVCPDGSTARSARLDQALEDLKLANVARSKASLDTFEDDKKPGGDLILLATDAKYTDALASLL